MGVPYLLLNPLIPYDNSKIQIRDTDITLVTSTPRFMYCTLRVGRLAYDLIVIHAPHFVPGADNRLVVEVFWEFVNTTVSKIHVRGTPVLASVDVNGRVGSITSDGIGPFRADVETDTGKEFRMFVERFSLRVPSTFAAEHKSEQSHTWMSSDGFKKRIDFFAYSNSISATNV